MRRVAVVVLALLMVVGAAGIRAGGPPAKGARVRISFAAAARAEPVTGRVYVAIARVPAEGAPASPASAAPQAGRAGSGGGPIQQAGQTGAPLFGLNVEGLKPGAAAVIDAHGLRPSGGEPRRDSRRASTGCSRSSTSTRSSRAPTATPSGCTWTSGKARTGSARRATSSATR